MDHVADDDGARPVDDAGSASGVHGQVVGVPDAPPGVIREVFDQVAACTLDEGVDEIVGRVVHRVRRAEDVPSTTSGGAQVVGVPDAPAGVIRYIFEELAVRVLDLGVDEVLAGVVRRAG